MNKISDKDILHAVLTLRPQWRELLGDTGATKAESLLAVAAQDDESARQAANLLMDLFDRHGVLAKLNLESPSKDGNTRFVPIYGESPVAASGIVYRCPIPDCEVEWQMQVVGEHIPHCAQHDKVLIPK